MNQHINKLEDPEVAKLRKEYAASALVRKKTSYQFPHFVRLPGKAGNQRLCPTGWQNRKGVLS